MQFQRGSCKQMRPKVRKGLHGRKGELSMNKKKLPLAFWIFIGLVVGIAVGLALMMVPGILTLVPLFLLSSNLGILNSKLAIILPGIRSQLPFGIFLVTAFVKGLSHEMFEPRRSTAPERCAFLHRSCCLCANLQWQVSLFSLSSTHGPILWVLCCI